MNAFDSQIVKFIRKHQLRDIETISFRAEQRLKKKISIKFVDGVQIEKTISPAFIVAMSMYFHQCVILEMVQNVQSTDVQIFSIADTSDEWFDLQLFGARPGDVIKINSRLGSICFAIET
jgi:hypothetical protein